MNDNLTVALAQIDLIVGDVAANTDRIVEFAERARDELPRTWWSFRNWPCRATRPKTCFFIPGCGAA